MIRVRVGVEVTKLDNDRVGTRWRKTIRRQLLGEWMRSGV